MKSQGEINLVWYVWVQSPLGCCRCVFAAALSRSGVLTVPSQRLSNDMLSATVGLAGLSTSSHDPASEYMHHCPLFLSLLVFVIRIQSFELIAVAFIGIRIA